MSKGWQKMFRNSALGTMAGISALVWTTASPAQGVKWGVFREVSFFGLPASNLRRCRIQEMAPSELILGEQLLAAAPTLRGAMSSYRMLLATGRCAP